ncbi:hypothetical protein K788_0000398 [Paraburkholderia caribensis MBA4]|uniref:Uncharacterized protein n=1 Tax=Paraburkholderia caribensis MBA4 TaxID=1323664 RepID=A0A0P0RII6_9BURK|nr:hypothetical protein K788_0000398 [Paraburkholderia caribensis MBA4]
MFGKLTFNRYASNLFAPNIRFQLNMRDSSELLGFDRGAVRPILFSIDCAPVGAANNFSIRILSKFQSCISKILRPRLIAYTELL